MRLTLTIKKWFEIILIPVNYLLSSSKIYIFLCFYLFFLSFNWNSSRLNWESGIEIFIPHITKIFLALSSLIYLFVRGVYIPIIKKINIKFLLPYNILDYFFSFIRFNKVASILYLSS